MLLDQLYSPSESDAEADEEYAARAQAKIEAENELLNYTTTIHENLSQIFDQGRVNEGVLYVVRLNLESLQEMIRRGTADESIVVNTLSLSFYMVSQQPWSNSPPVEQQDAFRNLYDLLMEWASAAEEVLVNTQVLINEINQKMGLWGNNP